ncbi:transposase [Roseovarius sp. Pro17]|uniref:transposase n=1 Tax=Roseovarius sp. Pro17 TaxID=3108175 RepID=UPI002D7678A3|nr:transposase [Roseovarius sp. Pro17]
MAYAILSRPRLAKVKRAFSTRRVPVSAMRGLITGDDVQPRPGDIVLARVDELGKQEKLELTDGRRAYMFPGDEIIVCYGNRYAPDQYESRIGPDLSPCDLVAAGGLASIEISRRIGLRPPTQITPVGLVVGADGERLNTMQFRVDASEQRPDIPAVLSLGTSMNAGKTLTATSLMRGFKRLGFKVAAMKITGTGSGGDMWIVRDAGADVSLDFTDAGYSSTYLVSVPEIERATYRLMNHAAAQGCDVAVIEIADGLQQLETAQLIRSRKILDVTIGSVFAAYDAMGAKYGVDVLREAQHNVLGISGRLGRSPLGVREAEDATGLRVYSPWDLQEGAMVPVMRSRAVEAGISIVHPFLARLARMAMPSNVMLSNLVAIGSASSQAGGAGATGTSLAHDLLERAAYHVMQLEVDALCAAPFGSRSSGRRDWRNGFRLHEWHTDFGRIDLRVPKLRCNHYDPSFTQKVTAPVAAVFAVIEAEIDAFDAAVSTLVREMLTGIRLRPGALDDLTADLAAQIATARRQGLPLMRTVQAPERPLSATIAAVNERYFDEDGGFADEPAYPGAGYGEDRIDAIGAISDRSGLN